MCDKGRFDIESTLLFVKFIVTVDVNYILYSLRYCIETNAYNNVLKLPLNGVFSYQYNHRVFLTAVIPSSMENLLGITAVSLEVLLDDIQQTKQQPDVLKNS